MRAGMQGVLHGSKAKGPARKPVYHGMHLAAETGGKRMDRRHKRLKAIAPGQYWVVENTCDADTEWLYRVLSIESDGTAELAVSIKLDPDTTGVAFDDTSCPYDDDIPGPIILCFNLHNGKSREGDLYFLSRPVTPLGSASTASGNPDTCNSAPSP
jgi:hypothetical protein